MINIGWLPFLDVCHLVGSLNANLRCKIKDWHINDMF